LGNSSTDNRHTMEILFNSPALAAQTHAIARGLARRSSDGTPLLRTASAAHNLATAYDGFTFYPAAGTITGTVRVYGYTNGA
jgi:hypothetical protein